MAHGICAGPAFKITQSLQAGDELEDLASQSSLKLLVKGVKCVG